MLADVGRTYLVERDASEGQAENLEFGILVPAGQQFLQEDSAADHHAPNLGGAAGIETPKNTKETETRQKPKES